MNKELHNNLIKTLNEKIPEKGKLSSKLADILFLRKEAVYRRLKGEVPFSFDEIAIIAKQMNICLDCIVMAGSSKKKPFQMKLVDYNNPTETDYSILQEYIDAIRVARNGNYSEYGAAVNTIPLHFIVKYKYLYKMYLLKWMYQFGSPDCAKTYSEIKTPEKLNEITEQYLTEIEYIECTYFVWDKFVFFYFINDIKYFVSLRLISQEELKLIKKELLILIDDLERLATTGKFSSGNALHFYLSRLNFDTTYTYIQTSEYNMTLIESYVLTEVVSFDDEVLLKMKTWIQSLKRSSTLISESGEIQRMLFFDKQREYVNEHL